MARPTKCRRVCRMPAARCFAPDIAGAGQVALTLDELECIRLLDWEGMTQEQCALQMQVARATVAGIYQRARRKLADALVHGRALRITGGEVRLCEHGVHCCGRCGAEACGHCTRCGTNQEISGGNESCKLR